MNKYCNFHEGHGHTTRQCYALREKSGLFIQIRAFKGILTPRGKETLEHDNRTQMQQGNNSLLTTLVMRIINVIS